MPVPVLAVADRAGLEKQKGLLAAVGNSGRAGNMRMAVRSGGVAMVNRLIRWAVTMLMVAALCFAFYEVGQEVGRSEAKIQVIEKQVEVIRYVEKKKAEIHARPNAGRDDLLKLMRAGRL